MIDLGKTKGEEMNDPQEYEFELVIGEGDMFIEDYTDEEQA